MAKPPPEIKTGTKWDATLNRGVCDRYNNVDLTLTLKIFFKKVDPPGGAQSGTFPDVDGTPRKIVRWGSHFTTWTYRFKREVEAFWHGKFWLKCPTGFDKWDYEDYKIKYRPNIWCRFCFEMVSSAAVAHHTIETVRLDPTEPFFRSHSKLYDNKDIEPQTQSHGGVKKTHVHEVGHLIGLEHVGVDGPLGVGWAKCLLHSIGGGSTNDSQCYGADASEQKDVMGSGSDRHEWHAKPWREAAEMFSGLGQSQWLAELKRHYPRSPDDITKSHWPTSKPARG